MNTHTIWTSCEDIEPHDAHEIDADTMCIGRSEATYETLEERIARIQHDHNVSESTAAHVARSERRLEETKAIRKPLLVEDGSHIHHLYPYGDEYEVDGVRHQKYRCTRCGGNTLTYFLGEDGTPHVKKEVAA